MNSYFFSFFIGLFLILSALLPGSKELWAEIDMKFFYLTNSWLAYDSIGAFVSLLNSRLGDWISHLAFSAILVSSIPRRKEAFYSLIGMVVFAILTQFLVNYCLFKAALNFLKDSPSLHADFFINIEKLFPFPNNHSTTVRSFPGDHSTTVFICSAWTLMAAGKRVLSPILTLAIFFSLPRIMAGAHGLSDVIGGAFGITLILLPLIVYSQRFLAKFSYEKSVTKV